MHVVTSNRCLLKLSVVALLLAPSTGLAASYDCPATAAELNATVAQTDLRWVEHYTGLESDYKADGDLGTIEMVYLPKRKGGITHVTSDGQVIFFYGDVRVKKRERLISMAYCFCTLARRGLTTRSSGR